MAKATPKPAEGQPVKFPPNWARMSQQEKRAWQEANRPGYNHAARAARPPSPATGLPATSSAAPMAERGAASDYNEANTYNESAEEQPQGTLFNENDLNDAAAQIDARKTLAKILRVLADAFAGDE